MPRPVRLYCPSQTDNMKVLLLLTAVIMAFGPIQIQGSFINFRQMILHKTGKKAEYSYIAYGCHCGLGGQGPPKDATDWCCFAHDCCYDRLEDRGCGTLYLHYNFNYRRGEIICSANQDPCRQQLCHCDKVAAECFARNRKSYNFWYQIYHIYHNSFCKGMSPSCSENYFLET
ncbi:hypothetical protein A6R68_02593 [Neotoma lepida]|uniref:Phospholipase A2 n=1 Tax=Neotoma lepida TaxID=56216 RepID=A0A1A6GRE4_NEOLE|nr:hypothetical protein A6R68_02593 [Neotoma lepida]